MKTVKKVSAENMRTFELLYHTARNAGIEIIEDKINRKGGVCRHRDRLIVVYDAHATMTERSRLILEAISQVNRDYIYMPPKVRMMLDREER